MEIARGYKFVAGFGVINVMRGGGYTIKIKTSSHAVKPKILSKLTLAMVSFL